MGYIPRLTEPSYIDKYWINTEYDGYNRCIVIGNGSVLPNCTGYAFGRFMEIMGTTSCTLSINNANKWFPNTSDGYKRGSKPQLGSVICWDRPGDAGHVAIVEQINSDGSIVTSNSAYGGSRFYTQTLYPPDYTWSDKYILQGFIYNPKIKPTDKIESFIKEVKSHINEDKAELSKLVSVYDVKMWSTAYIVACAKKCSLLNRVIPNSTNTIEFAKKGVENKQGSFIKSSQKPQVGDIVLLRISFVEKFISKYACDELGVVVEVLGKTINVVIGNKDNVKLKKYDTDIDIIAGYYRPDWSLVENNSSLMLGYGELGKFYETENTKADATIREVGYISDKYNNTTSKSKIKLAVLNYTTVMSAIFDNLLVPGLSGGYTDNVIVDGIENKNAQIIVEQLISKGINAAAAIGIIANIKHESNFDPGVIEWGYSFYNGGCGICQWTNYPRDASYGRKTNMVNFVGDKWRTNLTGQVEFLWYELQNNYPTLMNILETVPNSESGAMDAAEAFVRKFEVPANIDNQAIVRRNSASEFWKKIVVQMKSTNITTAKIKIST